MVNIGIIGCGAIAERRHAPACEAHSEVKIAGFADANAARAQEMANKYSTKAYASINEMLQDDAVDAVSICVPERFHHDVAIQCLKAGKHVLLEKPMAMDYTESQDIVRAWKESEKQLMIAFSQRFYPAHILAKELIRDGKIGQVLSFRTCQTNPGNEYAVLNPEPDYFDKRLSSIGGAMLNVGCHRIDLIRFLFDAEIDEVFAYTPALNKRFSDGTLINREDHAMLTLKLSNGVVGTQWTSWCNYGGEDIGTRIYGSEGSIYIPNYEKLYLYPRNGECVTYDIPQTHQMIYGWDVVSSFLDSMASGTPTAVSGYDGLQCMKILEAIAQSNAEGRWVDVRNI